MKTALVLFAFFTMLVGSVLGQSPNQSSHPGVLLFQHGKFREAVRSLETAIKAPEHKRDAGMWSYLGFAYLAIAENKKGVNAFEKSVSLNSSGADFRANLAYAHLQNRNLKKAREHADKAIALDARNSVAYQVRSTVNLKEDKLEAADRDADAFISFDEVNPAAYLLKTDILLSQLGKRALAGSKLRDEAGLLKRAIEVLESGVVKAQGSLQLKQLEQELESVSVFYEHITRDLSPAGPPIPQPGVEPVRILARPHARYTDKARSAGIEGSIRVVTLLGSNGKVDHVLFLTRLGYGLDEMVLEVARRIRFEPKRIDGKPVSVVLTLEYSFDIY